MKNKKDTYPETIDVEQAAEKEGDGQRDNAIRSRRSFLGHSALLFTGGSIAERGQPANSSRVKTRVESLLPLTEGLSDTETFADSLGLVVGSTQDDAIIKPGQRTGNLNLHTAAEGAYWERGIGGSASAGQLLFSTEWIAPHAETVTVSSEYTFSGNVLQLRDSTQFRNAVNKVELYARLVVRDLTTNEVKTEEAVVMDRVTPELKELAQDGLVAYLEALIGEVIPFPFADTLVTETIVKRPDTDIDEQIKGDNSLSVVFSANQGHTYEIQQWFEGYTAVVCIGGTPVEAGLSFTPTVQNLYIEESEREAWLDVSIIETNDPLPAGEPLELTVEAINAGSQRVTQDIQLLVGSDREVMETRTIEFGPGETRTLTIGYETYTVQQDVEFPVYVVTDDNEDRQMVEVFADGARQVDVTIVGANDPVSGGEYLEVTARVHNTSDRQATEEVRFLVGGDRELMKTQTVNLDPGEIRTLTMGYESYPVQQTVTFPLYVASDGDEDRHIVEVTAAND